MDLRPRTAGNNDAGVAYEIFVHTLLMPPVWLPPERVELVVDLGANVGMSVMWWLSNYWRARVIAFEPHPGHAAQLRANMALNGYADRVELHETAAGTRPDRARLSDAASSSTLVAADAAGLDVDVVDLLAMLAGKRVDILKIDIEGAEVDLLEDGRFAGLDVGVVVLEWHATDRVGRGGQTWCTERLEGAGFRTYANPINGTFGMLWGYRDSELGLATLKPSALPAPA